MYRVHGALRDYEATGSPFLLQPVSITFCFKSNAGQGLISNINVIAPLNAVRASIHLADLNPRSPICKVLLIDQHCTDGKEVTDKLSR